MRALQALLLVVAATLLSGCGYNTIQVQDEATKSAWSEVVNQYQRRADLIPNLVNTVKGFAAQEQAVLIGVTEARARATQVQVKADDPASLQQFQAAQGELSSALSRLMVVVEKYPDLNVDATLLYVLGHKDKLTDADKQLDSPYNTYTSKGLPPTAICNPGLACIMAAIAPEEHNYYYYVYDPATESHIFSRTLEQHNAAVAKVNAE